jgi:hypothetical protein
LIGDSLIIPAVFRKGESGGAIGGSTEMGKTIDQRTKV